MFSSSRTLLDNLTMDNILLREILPSTKLWEKPLKPTPFLEWKPSIAVAQTPPYLTSSHCCTRLDLVIYLRASRKVESINHTLCIYNTSMGKSKASFRAASLSPVCVLVFCKSLRIITHSQMNAAVQFPTLLRTEYSFCNRTVLRLSATAHQLWPRQCGSRAHRIFSRIFIPE